MTEGNASASSNMSEALARGMRMFCPYCASLYLDQFKDDGSADIGADKAMKAWGFDYNLLDFS